jgi:protein MpaA
MSFGEGKRTILFVGGQHGNEPAGATLARALARHLTHRASDAMGCRVLVIPTLNPDGLLAGTRANANGVDLNRDFPASNASAGEHTPQPETRFVIDLLARYRPAVVVSIHQPLSCVDYDGPARQLAMAMASRIDLDVDKLGARAGSLGSYAGVDRNAAVITLELPAEASGLSSEHLWRAYGSALLEAIRYRARLAR